MCTLGTVGPHKVCSGLGWAMYQYEFCSLTLHAAVWKKEVLNHLCRNHLDIWWNLYSLYTHYEAITSRFDVLCDFLHSLNSTKSTVLDSVCIYSMLNGWRSSFSVDASTHFVCGSKREPVGRHLTPVLCTIPIWNSDGRSRHSAMTLVLLINSRI